MSMCGKLNVGTACFDISTVRTWD